MDKIKKYFIEFLMIFLGITLGFFAENMREDYKIKKSMIQNYKALIDDLRADSITINRYNIEGTKAYADLVKLHTLIYDFHSKKISWDSLKIKMMEIDRLPSYGTVFINNSTFKAIQSSGLLSGLDDKQLTRKLSYYYEVILKRVEDNNKIFDQIGIEFYNKQFPFVPYNFTNRLFENSDLKKPDNYKEFLFGLQASKKIICSEGFVFDLDAFSGKVLHYNSIKETLYKENQSLLKTLYKIQQQN